MTMYKQCIILITASLGSWLSFAQDTLIYNHQNNIHLKDGASIYVEGSVYNHSTINSLIGLYDGSELHIEKDFHNNGNLDCGPDDKGVLRFFGNGTSHLRGNYAFPQNGIGKLVIDKGFQVRVVANSVIRVEDSLIFEGGILQTGSFFHIAIPKPDSGRIKGFTQPGVASDDKYVYGSIRQAISPSLPYYDFPVGGSHLNLGYQLLRVKPRSLGTYNYIEVSFQPPSFPLSQPSNVNECGAIYSCVLTDHGNWKIFTPDSIHFDLQAMPRNFTADCGTGVYTLASSDTALDGQSCTAYVGSLDDRRGTLVYRENVLQTDRLFITGSLTPFPVEWLYFQARKEGHDAHLSWGTSNEQNHDYFLVEKSTDMENFEAIGRVKQPDSDPNTYSFVDKNVGVKEAFYRIKQVDLNGSYDYSQVRSLRFDNFAFAIGPNPSRGTITIYLPENIPGKLELLLFNHLGQEVFSREIEPRYKQPLNLEHLANGSYSYQFRQNGVLVKNGLLQKLP